MFKTKINYFNGFVFCKPDSFDLCLPEEQTPRQKRPRDHKGFFKAQWGTDLK
jgi:hypothetical protein